MKKKTNAILIGVIYAIIFIVLNILIFVVFKPWKIENAVAKTNFWTTYAFLIVSFGLQIGSLFLFDRKSGIDAVFMGMPVFIISAIFFGVEAVLSLIFFVLSAFNVAVPTSLVVVLQILVLAAYLIIAILAILAKNHITSVDQKIKVNVAAIRNLESDVIIAMEACADSSLKESLRKLADSIRFSDPMSTPAVEALDIQLQSTIMEIKAAAYDSKYELLTALIRKAELQLKERNLKVSNSK